MISYLGFWLVPAVSVEPKQALYPRTSAGEVFFPLGQILNFRVDNSRCDHRLGDGGSQPPTRPACPRGSAYRPLDWPSHVSLEPQVVGAWNQNLPSGPGRWPGGRGRHGPGGITHSRLRPLDSGTEPLPRRRLKAAPGSPKGRICVPWRVSGVGALYRVCHGGARSIVTPNAEAAQTAEAVLPAVNACARCDDVATPASTCVAPRSILVDRKIISHCASTSGSVVKLDDLAEIVTDIGYQPPY